MKAKRESMRRLSRARGFTMMEVLVSMLVTLVGVLGVTSMQVISVQNNQGAYLRTQATVIASDMLDRIRINKAGQDAEGYKGGSAWPFKTSAGIPSDSTAGCTTSANGCSGAQLANLDLRELGQNFENVMAVSNYKPMLPNGRAEINKVVNGGLVEYTVAVYWSERDWEASGGNTVRGEGVSRMVELRSVIRDK